MTNAEIEAEMVAFIASQPKTRRQRRLDRLAEIRANGAKAAPEITARHAASPIVITEMHAI